MKQNQVYGFNESENGISMKCNDVYGIRTEKVSCNDDQEHRNEYEYVATTLD